MKRPSSETDADVIRSAKNPRSTLEEKEYDRNDKTQDGAVQSDGTVLVEEREAGLGIRCLHEVVLPHGYKRKEKSEGFTKGSEKKAAKEYPFQLDPFQIEAVKCLEQGESVMVSAHTSAGKTVVAEYAIAMALRDKQRVVYTSPIKALSNQKFRELAEEFSDVGLMTGDVTIAPRASCLVMTTEILRSMFYRGSEVMREVRWIIFDEVHYLRDRERGVVWEESIVMAPKDSRFVFLSATVPNAKEFAEWIAKIHRHPCHIVYTDYRPTPLQHYVFPEGGKGLHLVVDEKGDFREENFQRAIMELGATEMGENRDKKKGKGDKWEGGRGGGTNGPSDIFKIVKLIMSKQYDPVIVFSFSKVDCENLGNQMAKLDLNDEDEKKLVEGVFNNAMDSLSPDDKKLPQVTRMLPLLLRGIGVHHSGLLPILKEVIEILFQEGLLKCLFATETFSIGLNMPAKTVVFTGVRKFDGTAFRFLSGGEYVQMSGRAGRRGLDDKGVCVLVMEGKMEPSVAKGMLRGRADALDSAFHLTYNMVLNQMRREDSDMESLIRQSFAQFQAEKSLPSLQKKMKELEIEMSSVQIEDEKNVETIQDQIKQKKKLRNDIRKIINSPVHALPFLSPGRIVRILCRKFDENETVFENKTFSDNGTFTESGTFTENGTSTENGTTVTGKEKEGLLTKDGKLKIEEPMAWGLVVNFQKVSVSKSTEEDEENVAKQPEIKFIVDILAMFREDEDGQSGRGKKKLLRPCLDGEEGVPQVAALPLEQVDGLSAIRLHLPKDLGGVEGREASLKALKHTLERFPEGIQMLDPEEDMEVSSGSYRKAIRRMETLESIFSANPVASSPTLVPRLMALQKKQDLGSTLKVLKREVKVKGGLIFQDELKARKRVLRRLGFASSEEVVQLKGRVACELSSVDEIVMTELIFGGTFRELSPSQAAALVSCFIWQEKTNEGGGQKLKDYLANPLRELRDVARRVGKVQEECKLPIEVDEFVNSFRPEIMEATYFWCQGSKFGEILKLTEKVFEGSLIRGLRRLEEVLRQLVTACGAIGEEDLKSKFEEGIKLMKRDIVFAASLYL